MATGIWESFIDVLIPPRASERVVRTLTLGELQQLDHEDGLPYHDPRVTALVWELKYYATRRAAALAGALLAEKLLAVAAEELGKPLLIPIPMHAARRRERGHNQTEVLCKAALGRLGGDVEYAPRALERTVNTKHQQGLPRHIRLKNIKGAMRVVQPVLVKERMCIVVDDVSTTGATLEEAKRALWGAGARVVHTLVLARS